VDSDLRLTGEARDAKLGLAFGDLGGRCGLGWASARAGGFALGKADLPVELVSGQLVVPLTAVEAGGGTIRLGGAVDLRKKHPQLVLPGSTVVLEGVRINRDVGRLVLSRFNPIFAQLASLDGWVTLVARDIDVSLDEKVLQAGTGSGRLDLSGLKLEPGGGLLADLLALGGLAQDKAHDVRVGSVDFVLRDGGIQYENFTIAFDETFDLRFRGTVRFDDRLALAVSVPLRAALLRKLGLGEQAEEYARLLEGARLELPLAGTRLAPRLDLAKVDVRALVRKAGGRLPVGRRGL
jgi:hypothetical protein